MGQAVDQSARLIRVLTLTIFLQWMGASSLIPMLPVYIRRLGGSDALAGVVMASFFAAGVLSQYPIGRLADRIGRRPVLDRRPGDLRLGQPGVPAPDRCTAHHRAPFTARGGDRRGRRGLTGHGLELGGRGAPGTGLRLRLRCRTGRHGHRAVGGQYRRRPVHVGHVPRFGPLVVGGVHSRHAHPRDRGGARPGASPGPPWLRLSNDSGSTGR